MARIFSKFSYLRRIILVFLTAVTIFGATSVAPFFLFGEVQAVDLQSQVTIVITVCGNGVVEVGESCDDGANNGQYGYCKTDCSGMGPHCGDGILQSNYEECDDGNTVSGDGCSSSCQTEAAAPPSAGGGGGGYVPPPKETKVILQGKAYPQATLTLLQDGKVITTKKTDSQANFKIEITGLTAGTYTFGLWAEDKKGRRSITFSFTTSVKKDTITTIGGIFIPPTIELEKFSVTRGEILNILGQTAPESEVTISVESPEEITKETEADEEGNWDYPFNTSHLAEGLHTTRAKAKSPEGLLSSYSKVLSFHVGKFGVEEICPKADFNKDGKTNLVDFSIMLYWWGKYNPCVDQNQNGIVDLPDFSILMYWWTG